MKKIRWKISRNSFVFFSSHMTLIMSSSVLSFDLYNLWQFFRLLDNVSLNFTVDKTGVAMRREKTENRGKNVSQIIIYYNNKLTIRKMKNEDNFLSAIYNFESIIVSKIIFSYNFVLIPRFIDIYYNKTSLYTL